MTKTFSIRVEIRNEKEFIRLADEVEVALMEVDNITPPEPRASGSRSKLNQWMCLSATEVAGG